MIEGNETVVIGIVSVTGSSTSISASEFTTTTTLTDDDSAQILLSLSPTSISESGGVSFVTVYIS